MSQALSQKYDLRVPRYTSYPTSPHFSEAVGHETYRGWLENLDPKTPLSLYTHIPFCDEMCWFCGCFTKIVKKYEPVSDYLDVVLAEIDLLADTLPGRFSARHLHWGGGSPTMLTGADWMRTLDKLRSRFDIDEHSEIAVEMDPRTATEGYVKAVTDAGVNRASIGVQDFDAKVQEAIHRIQPYDVTARVVGWLRDHGVKSINMDLMYGLPHQTTELVLKQIDLAHGLAPARVALFGYAHVPWMKTHQKMIDEAVLPGADDRWEQLTMATEKLKDLGYVQIGFDHFARPDDEMAVALAEGRLRRNFQGYTVDDGQTLVGLGASSIGNLPQGYAQNTQRLRQYADEVKAGRFPVVKGFELTAEDETRRGIIEKIMCELTVDLGAFEERFEAEIDALSPLADDGIVALDGDRITVTEEGRPFVRLVAATFDTYLASGKARHSRAV
ncbi:MAG: oxygen-independent coproporphyrinogen III oxidase [Magnetovibrionaceae bacterium]